MKSAIFCFFFFFSTALFCLEDSVDKHRLQEFIHYQPTGPNPIGYLSIEKHRMIDQSTYLYIKFALDHFKKINVPFVVLRLNTPGGEVFAAMQIAQLLQNLDVNDHIPVIAFIDNWAISAGAMLAYSCRFIAATTTASMGAAEPQTVSNENQMESASEKVNSALRSEFANLARFYGRDPLIAEAMVDKDLILVLREGNIIKLEDENQIRLSGENPDQVISKKGKLLTLNAEQLINLKVADFEVAPQALLPLTEEEKQSGQWPASKNLLFQEPFLASIPQATLISFHDWRISFFAFLSHPLISSLLFMGLIIGIYLEMSHPGFGLPGITALICLTLILLSSFAVQTINWLELIILGAGILLLVMEIFFLPGFGVAGGLGILLTLGGLVALMLPNLQGFNFTLDSEKLNLITFEILKRLAYFFLAIIVSLVIIFVTVRFFSRRFSLFKKLILKGEQESIEGFISGMPKESLPTIGSEGTVFSALRPAGKVEISGQIFVAVSEGKFIEKGERVSVVRVEGAKVVVRNCRLYEK
jgi:membrane-bound ClpP family serine protease